jgi:mono/diheme cytochrome c family protein
MTFQSQKGLQSRMTTKKPLFLAAALLLFGAPLAAQDPYHPVARDTLDADTYNGWKTYEVNCARCHGEYGIGTSFAPSLVVSLKENGTIPTQQDFMTVVCAGRVDKGMPAWCTMGLEIDKIQKMYMYLKSRADGKIAAGRPALRREG